MSRHDELDVRQSVTQAGDEGTLEARMEMKIDFIEQHDGLDLLRIGGCGVLRRRDPVPRGAEVGEPGDRGAEAVGKVDGFDLASRLAEDQTIRELSLLGLQLLPQDLVENSSERLDLGRC